VTALQTRHAAVRATASDPAGELVVGTRGSSLALWQTQYVLERLRARHPSLRVRVEEIKTRGDHTQAASTPLTQLGDKSIFVAELEQALLAGSIDAAVHSLKDLPGRITDGLALAAITPREDARDALVSRHGQSLRELPRGAAVATSSLRRAAQVSHLRPDVRIVSIRGNVDTRLRKTLAAEGPDATILAVAGLKRLGLEQQITAYLAIEDMVPAVGQGALAVEVRAGDVRTRRLLRTIDDVPTRRAVTAERAVLAALGGGCRVPLGAYVTPVDGGVALRLLAIVASLDGTRLVRVERTGPASRPTALGQAVARELLAQGGADILREIQRLG